MATHAPGTQVDERPVRHGSAHGTVWFRRCASCGHDDLDAAFGQPALIPEHRWRCPGCASPDWEAARATFPAEPTGRCPYRDAR